MDAHKPLWSPNAPEKTHMNQFRLHINKHFQLSLKDYAELQQWSVNYISDFWEQVWDYTGIISSEKCTGKAIDLSIPMQDIPAWFPGAKLNWAQNQLRCRSTSKTALIETSEPPIGQPLVYSRISYDELYRQVHTTALALKSLSLTPNSILAYYGPTSAASVILLLACSSIGAIWSSAAADFGPIGVLERFEQFGDRLWGVVGVESVRYNGKVQNQKAKLAQVIQGLNSEVRKTPLKVVIVDYLKEGKAGEREQSEADWLTWEQLQSVGESEKASKTGSEKENIDFYQGDFDRPLWVLFSSGTTGKPKAIVHRAGGMLIQSLKEHVIHGDMGPDDVFFYYTTPGWMMYNYLVSALATGCTLVLFDGSPLFRPELLWDMAQELGVTVFGTSAKYLDVLSKSYKPIEHHPLPSLKQVLSTGSPLKPELFPWVYQNIKKDLLLGSITGGTDICSLFAGHNAALPVYMGEIQCISLGMAIDSFDESGKAITDSKRRSTEAGELVCVKPFPCMPIFFWNDEGGKRYRSSYFEKFDGVWAHGDFCIITESQSGNGGGLVMLGRSDGVLNPSGVRFGSSEIYEVIDQFPTEIEDSLAVAQKTQGGSDERVILFIKMMQGQELTAELLKDIKTKIRTTRSARHVPEKILQVKDIPHTINGKKVEVPIKKLLGGAPLSSINLSTLRNPECLDEYISLGQVLRKEIDG